MLMEMLFSMVFFLLPVIGMFGAVIARGLQPGEKAEERTMTHIGGRRERPLLASTLADNPVMRYQLVENKVHMPLKFIGHKRIFHQRAGP